MGVTLRLWIWGPALLAPGFCIVVLLGCLVIPSVPSFHTFHSTQDLLSSGLEWPQPLSLSPWLPLGNPPTVPWGWRAGRYEHKRRR